MRVAFAVGLCLPLILTGCELSPPAAPTPQPGLAIQGSIYGGQQPIYQSHVYLMAANTTGDAGPGIAASSNNASASLTISGGSTDSVGSYVLTNMNGGFSFPNGSYSCTPNTQVYIYALGGNPGFGTNSGASLMAALGNCPSSGTFITQAPFVSVNEVSTIAAAFALAGFATDSTHVSSSGSTAAQLGIQNAFANAANLADIASGTALATTPAGNGTAPQATVNTLANIIAACINTDGTVSGPTSPTACYSLFNAAAASKTLPTDTATAAIDIAHNPAANVDTLYRLQNPQLVFAPALTGVTEEPTDLALGIQFTGGGINDPSSVAIDSSGNVWIANAGNNSVTKLASNGSPISSSSGYAASGISSPEGIAIDASGNAWIANDYNPTIPGSSDSLIKLSSTGTDLSSGGYTNGGLSSPYGIMIDASGNAWTPNAGDNSITELSNSGSVVGSSPITDGSLNVPEGIAIDASGNVWIANSGGSDITELSSAGAVLSGVNGYSGGGLSGPNALAIDASGNAWISNPGGNSVTELSTSGGVVAGSPLTGGGLNQPWSVAIDGASSAWIANLSGSSVTQISNAGFILSGSNGYQGSQIVGGVVNGLVNLPVGIAVDGSGNVWTVGSSVTELIGVATPVVTPLAIGVVHGTLGTRP